MTTLQIIGVPMDLGASRRGVDMGPSAMRVADLDRRLVALGHAVEDRCDVRVPLREGLLDQCTDAPPPGPKFLPAIAGVCAELARLTEGAVAAGKVPVAVGGDHSLAAGSVAGVSTALARRGERLGVIWLDAHADVNTPETSLTGNVHGMPLAHLLGHGDPALAGLAGGAGPAVRAENVALVGVRDIDAAERRHLREWGVATYTMRDLDERGLRAVMEDALRVAGRGTAGIHLSCDLDWVDPVHAPGVGTPVAGGASYREAHLAMEIAADSGRLTSLDIVEINPVLDERNRTAELAAGLVLSAFGLRIL
ncbi:MAG TPA: arginase [Gemmatimonadaceae bacterium]|nr:arginase [Gemmatimonadaceae bacterium]